MNQKRKGFTLIELLIVVVIVGILALAAIPLITSNTRDARRAEGTQLMQSARDYARVEYSKAGEWSTLAGDNFDDQMDSDQWTGNYYEVTAITTPAVDATITATANNADDGDGTLTFQWASGESSIVFN